MPSFGKRSQKNLSQCHPDLQLLFNTVVRGFDCSVICGHRNEKEQTVAFLSRPQKSKVEWPDSGHNSKPSKAVDVVPYPVDWDDLKRFYLFAGYVRAKAEMLGIKIRGGHDWDGDTKLDDQNFDDLPHWEIIV